MLTWRVLLFQAIATSIDAFAVGVSLLAMDVRVVRLRHHCRDHFFVQPVGAVFGTALWDGSWRQGQGGRRPDFAAIAIKAIL